MKVSTKTPHNNPTRVKKLRWGRVRLIISLGLLSCIAYPSIGQAAVSNNNGITLGIEASPAVCSIYPNYNKLRQCIDGSSFTINYFDTGNRGQCVMSNHARLTPLQENVVAKFIPDGYVRQQMWQNYGKCSGMSVSNYFRSITNLTTNLSLPSEIINSSSYRVNYGKFLQKIATANPGLSPQSLRLYCQMNRKNQMLLTHINVCYNSTGRFAQCGSVKPTTCPNEFTIQGRY